VRGRELVVATGNAGKLREFRELLAELPVALRSLAELPGIALPEEGDDYTANAIAKARAVAAGDRLCSDRRRLGNRGGCARGATRTALGALRRRGLDDAGRVALLLGELAECARVRAVRASSASPHSPLPGGAVETARGECPGQILTAPRGSDGFGYDPVSSRAANASRWPSCPRSARTRSPTARSPVRALRPAIERALARPGEFVLIRHAESIWNAEERWQGQADPPLSARGVAQAEAVRARNRSAARRPRSCAATCSARALTAEIVGRALGLAPNADARLRASSTSGAGQASTRREIEALDAALLQRFEAEDPEVSRGRRRVARQIRARVRAAFHELAQAHPGERFWSLVTHPRRRARAAAGTDLANAESVAISADELPAAE
jgi:XTP/dITP diphosphohydrolase